MIATFIKQADNMKGQAEVYDVDPPIKGFSYDGPAPEYSTVVVSSVYGEYATECFIFPWDKENDCVASWGELEGSRKGPVTPEGLLQELGYTIEYKED